MFEVGVYEMEDALPAKFQTPLYPLYIFAERGEVKWGR